MKTSVQHTFGRHRLVGATAAAVVLAFLAGGLTGCDRKDRPASSGQREKVTIAVSPQPVSAPVYVAFGKGFFERQGLAVTLAPYTSGKEALDAVVGGQAQFATAAETPIALAGLTDEKIFIAATIARSNKYMMIIARKDRGISSAADLKGRKLGVSRGTNGDFFLHAYLTINHLAQEDIQISDVRPDDMVDALTTGRVDAVSTWAPHTTKLEKQLGDNASVLHDPDVYEMTWNIVIPRELASAHPDLIVRFLRALVEADRFIQEHRSEACAMAAEHIGLEPEALDEIWDLYGFGTALNQSLILNMEDQARWMIKRSGPGGGTIPNFLDFIYTDGLKAVRPEAVRITGTRNNV